jgi:hypothetical protein
MGSLLRQTYALTSLEMGRFYRPEFGVGDAEGQGSAVLGDGAVPLEIPVWPPRMETRSSSPSLAREEMASKFTQPSGSGSI